MASDGLLWQAEFDRNNDPDFDVPPRVQKLATSLRAAAAQSWSNLTTSVASELLSIPTRFSKQANLRVRTPWGNPGLIRPTSEKGPENGRLRLRREPTLQTKLLQVCLKGESENNEDRGSTRKCDSCWTEERKGENKKEKRILKKRQRPRKAAFDKV